MSTQNHRHYANSNRSPELGDVVEPIFGGKTIVVAKRVLPVLFGDLTLGSGLFQTSPSCMRLVGGAEESVCTTADQTAI